MKRILVFLLVIFSSVFSVTAQDKDIVTEKYKVSGECEQCKKRIEDAAYIKGVKFAEWDVKTGILTVTYRPSKTSAQDILDHVAAAGHDNEKVAAPESAYNKLPKCCHYKTAKK